MLEQYWAAKAGIGWIGKNSLILDKDIGSYMFLGILLTSVELDADEEAEDKCGSCRLCIDKCPTHAITEDRQVDSPLCISYNTIENRANKLPDDINLDGWVYGCDICQDICPYNTYKSITSEPDFLNYNKDRGDFAEETITEERYDKLTQGSAMRRAKYHQFIRNIKHNKGAD